MPKIDTEPQSQYIAALEQPLSWPRRVTVAMVMGGVVTFAVIPAITIAGCAASADCRQFASNQINSALYRWDTYRYEHGLEPDDIQIGIIELTDPEKGKPRPEDYGLQPEG